MIAPRSQDATEEVVEDDVDVSTGSGGELDYLDDFVPSTGGGKSTVGLLGELSFLDD
jgi:hypothetical protein